MKTKLITNVSFLFALSLLASCGSPESDLDKLKAKELELKTELAEITKQISELDTTSNENVILLVSSTPVERKDFAHKIELQGAVESDNNILINAEMPGNITKVYVKEGQRVSKGQTLIALNGEVLQSNINEVKTALDMANYMYEKQLKLQEQGLGTEIELVQAKNQKLSLEDKLNTLRSQTKRTVVKAPFSGIVDEVFVSMGEMANGQSPLIRLVNNDNVKVTASVSEKHLSSVKIGTEIDVEFPDMQDTTITTSISYKGSYIDPVNRTFRVQADLKQNKTFLPNQIAKIKITDLQLDSVLVVNSEAVLQDTDNSNYVYKLTVSDAGKNEYTVKKVMVKVVKSYQNETVIQPLKSNELKQGSKIVLEGAKGITENDIVKIQ